MILFLGVGCGREPSSESSSQPAAPPEAAVAIPLLQGDGESLTMDSLRGKVVLVDFCATWSAPSRMGVEDLNGLQSTWVGSGLTVLGLCVDEGEREAVASLVAELGAGYSVGWADTQIQELFGGIRPIPTRILLDRDGQEVARFEGAVAVEKLEEAIRPLLDPALSPQS